MVVLCALFLYCTEKRKYLSLRSSYICLVPWVLDLVPWFVLVLVDCAGMLVDCLALMAAAVGGRFWGPEDCNRDSSWQAIAPRVVHSQQTETHPPVSERGLLLLLELQPERKDSTLPHI